MTINLPQDDANHIILILNKKDWREFQQILNQLPAVASEKLKGLLASTYPWDSKNE